MIFNGMKGWPQTSSPRLQVSARLSKPQNDDGQPNDAETGEDGQFRPFFLQEVAHPVLPLRKATSALPGNALVRSQKNPIGGVCSVEQGRDNQRLGVGCG